MRCAVPCAARADCVARCQPRPALCANAANPDASCLFCALFAHQATSGICYRTLQYADSQVNKLEITPDKHYLAGAPYYIVCARARLIRTDSYVPCAAAGNPAIRLFEVNTNNPQPITSFEGHTNNVTAVGFERDGRWMYSGSEDGTVKIWDLRASGFQREYESRGAVNSVVLHPNQARAHGFRCARSGFRRRPAG